MVIGGGLLGLEAANGLKLRGMNVTVVHLMPWLMERQLDRTAAQLLQQSLEAKGLEFRLEAQDRRRWSARTTAASRRCEFAGGETLPADLVVMAVGIRPERRARASRAGLHCDRGIVVNDTLQTVRSAHLRGRRMRRASRHRPTGSVAPLFEMAKVVRQPPRAARHRPLRRLADVDQAQGDRHRPLLGRRLHRRRRDARRSC